ncbi:CotS family spore coat protein [Cohnella panacarvi]|uniref:CotS family spore coat protein n=1 Tax=Cohnella panacarvi TaxID=400776 RepID=UPI00047C4074|nr:CotS family spore coat protein [Cohnella panacarvi]
MEEYRIVPWDHDESVPIGVDREFYIPPEIERVAHEVIAQYDMQVSEMTLITSKPDKGGAIWRIMTDKGPRSLKVLHREPRRSLFCVYAQQWLVEQGARVPALIKTKSGQLYVEAGHKLWIVTDWISLVPASKVDIEGAESLVFGLGEFHRASRGYVPPEFAQQKSRIHHWPKYYSKMIEKIGWMRDLAKAYPDAAGSGQLLSVVDQFESQAKEALAKFENSSFRRMVVKGDPYWGLVHQDYGFSNGQVGEGGIWVIDLDGVAYDFPIRDLRKMITSMMDDMGVWDPAIMRRLIQAYHGANPIDRETYELLVIDMMFPNEFYKHIKEMIFDPLLFMNTEMGPILERVIATQESKQAALAELEREAESYAPGDYEEVPAEARTAPWMRESVGSALEPFGLQLDPSVPSVPGVPSVPSVPSVLSVTSEKADSIAPAKEESALVVLPEIASVADADVGGPIYGSPLASEPQGATPVATVAPAPNPAHAERRPVPPATDIPAIVLPRRAVQRSNRTPRRRKRLASRRTGVRPRRRTQAKPAVRSATRRKAKPKKLVARKRLNVVRRRKAGRRKVRKAVRRA